MKNGFVKDSIVISKNEVRTRGGLVILPLEEYRRLKEQAVPSYVLSGKAAQKLDALVEYGMKAYRAGKTKKIESLADLD